MLPRQPSHAATRVPMITPARSAISRAPASRWKRCLMLVRSSATVGSAASSHSATTDSTSVGRAGLIEISSPSGIGAAYNLAAHGLGPFTRRGGLPRRSARVGFRQLARGVGHAGLQGAALVRGARRLLEVVGEEALRGGVRRPALAGGVRWAGRDLHAADH